MTLIPPVACLSSLIYSIAANVLIFLWEASLSDRQLQNVFLSLSVVPRNISAAPFSLESILDTFRSMFFHGGWSHLLGNMLYLYLFGDNVEDFLGKIFFILVYFCSGVAAVAAQVMIDPNSTIPLVGASGAIAGILGGYLVLFPTVKVQGIIFLGRIGTLQTFPAWVVLGFWFVLQIFNGAMSLGVATDETAGGGVAFFAHIGGFVLGLILTFILMQMMPHPSRDEREGMLYERRRY